MSVTKQTSKSESRGPKDLKVLKVLKTTKDFNIQTCSNGSNPSKAQQSNTSLKPSAAESSSISTADFFSNKEVATANIRGALGSIIASAKANDEHSLTTPKNSISSNHFLGKEDRLENQSESLPSPTSPIPELETQALNLSELEPGGEDIKKLFCSNSGVEKKSGKPSITPRKRKTTERKPIGRPLAKKPRITRDQQYDIDLSITCDVVKKCIVQVNDKLDKNKFKAVCRKVSKQMVFIWTARKPEKKKNIQKWLNNRHVKIVRLIERYLELN